MHIGTDDRDSRWKEPHYRSIRSAGTVINSNKTVEYMIQPSDISVVIQGPTLLDLEAPESPFYKCIESIRRVLPGAEIIVSTWKGQSCDQLLVDKVIFNDDPGTISTATGQSWNFNRMVASTRNGLAKATRLYSLKFRADLSLTDCKIFITPPNNDVPESLRHYKIFKHPITTTNIYIRNPASRAPLLFHVSDIVQFGLTEDLRELWNRDFVFRKNLATDISYQSAVSFLGYTGLKMVPEQALTTGWLNAKGYQIDIPFPGFVSKKYCELSELILSCNFHVVDWSKSGISFPRRFTHIDALSTIYNADYVNNLCKLYADPLFSKRRFRSIFWHAYILRIFQIHFWIDFAAAILLKISPKCFSVTQSIWRKLIVERRRNKIIMKQNHPA